MTENCKLRKAILSAFYNITQRNFGILLILWCSFKLWWNVCLDLFRSKFSLLRKWSIYPRQNKQGCLSYQERGICCSNCAIGSYKGWSQFGHTFYRWHTNAVIFAHNNRLAYRGKNIISQWKIGKSSKLQASILSLHDPLCSRMWVNTTWYFVLQQIRQIAILK
jgi:hypothetical protein